MRIPTIPLALLAAALSGSAGAGLTKAFKVTIPGPAFLAARDYAARPASTTRRILSASAPIPSPVPTPNVSVPCESTHSCLVLSQDLSPPPFGSPGVAGALLICLWLPLSSADASLGGLRTADVPGAPAVPATGSD